MKCIKLLSAIFVVTMLTMISCSELSEGEVLDQEVDLQLEKPRILEDFEELSLMEVGKSYKTGENFIFPNGMKSTLNESGNLIYDSKALNKEGIDIAYKGPYWTIEVWCECIARVDVNPVCGITKKAECESQGCSACERYVRITIYG